MVQGWHPADVVAALTPAELEVAPGLRRGVADDHQPEPRAFLFPPLRRGGRGGWEARPRRAIRVRSGTTR